MGLKYYSKKNNCKNEIADISRAAKKRNDGDVKCVICGCFLSIYNNTDRCFRHRNKKDNLDLIGWFDSMCTSRSVCLMDERSDYNNI